MTNKNQLKKWVENQCEQLKVKPRDIELAAANLSTSLRSLGIPQLRYEATIFEELGVKKIA